LRSINGNGGRSFVDRLLESVFVTGSNVSIGSFFGSNIAGLEVASSVLSSVRVRGFRVNTVVGNDVVHGSSHQTSIETFVSLSGRAVDQVLFGETDQRFGSKEVASFNRSGGRERPARSALSLILDGGDGTLGGPVKRVREGNVGGIERGSVNISLRNSDSVV